jgi:hypothetical protein
VREDGGLASVASSVVGELVATTPPSDVEAVKEPLGARLPEDTPRRFGDLVAVPFPESLSAAISCSSATRSLDSECAWVSVSEARPGA